MMENYQTLSSLGCILIKPGIISKIEQGIELYLDERKAVLVGEELPTESVSVKPEIVSRMKEENQTSVRNPPRSECKSPDMYVVPNITARIKQEKEPVMDPSRYGENVSTESVSVKPEIVSRMKEENQTSVRNQPQAEYKSPDVYVVPNITARIKQEKEPVVDPLRYGENVSTESVNVKPEIVSRIKEENQTSVRNPPQAECKSPAHTDVYVVPNITARIKQEKEPVMDLSRYGGNVSTESVSVNPEIVSRMKEENQMSVRNPPRAECKSPESVSVKPEIVSRMKEENQTSVQNPPRAECKSPDVHVVPNITSRIKQEKEPVRDPLRYGENVSTESVNVKPEIVSRLKEENQTSVGNPPVAEYKSPDVYVVPNITSRIKQEKEPVMDPLRYGENISTGCVYTKPKMIIKVEDERCVNENMRRKEEEQPTGDTWTQSRNHKNTVQSSSFQEGMRAPNTCVDVFPLGQNDKENTMMGDATVAIPSLPHSHHQPPNCYTTGNDWIIEDVVTPVESSNGQDPSNESVVNVWFVKRVMVNNQNSIKDGNVTDSPYVIEQRGANHSVQKRSDNQVVDGSTNSERKPFVDVQSNSHVRQETSTNVSGFVKHQPVHDHQASVCSECGERFQTKTALEEHVIHHMEEELQACPVCAQCFTSQSDLEKHSKIHQGGTSWPCRDCGKSFYTRSGLERHQLIHVRDTPLPCPECGKYFLKRSNYEMHLRLHAGEVLHACTECEKMFSTKTACDRHIRAHKKERLHVCPECGKRFLYNGCLIRHLRTHTGERPFACPLCDKSFRQTSALNRHVKTHTGEKPFDCPECGKCFTHQSDVMRHQETHRGDQPFVEYVMGDDDDSSPTYVIL